MGHKGYKGFEKGLVCRGKRYSENTVFEEDSAVICKSGMHYCENPFDVLDHYDLINNNGDFNDFAEVEALDDPNTDDNKKFCTTKLRIGGKLSFAGFIKACIDFVLEKTKISEECGGNQENSAQIGSSGYSAQIGSSGDYAKIDSTGLDSVVCCAGNGSSVKAKKGSWITLAEWEYDESKNRFVPKCVKTAFVDGETIKEDTFYVLKNGKFEEIYNE